jgi:hypothetical protein
MLPLRRGDEVIVNLAAPDVVHAAAALGCQVVVPGQVTHEARMLLELALVPFVVAHAGERPRAGLGRHTWRRGEADLDAYAASGLPMRAIDEVGAALAAGSVLAECAA